VRGHSLLQPGDLNVNVQAQAATIKRTQALDSLQRGRHLQYCTAATHHIPSSSNVTSRTSASNPAISARGMRCCRSLKYVTPTCSSKQQ
jgi:hypothetical protein